MKIIPLSEGSFTVDKTKFFVPFDTGRDHLQHRTTGSLLVEVQPFVVITSKDIVLIDAGLGFMQNNEMQIYANLKANGIHPENISKVLMSHLHKDHAGGISKRDHLGNYTSAFTNAIYYVNKKEYEYATDEGFPSFMPEELSVLENNHKVFWIEDEQGTIDGYITYQTTSAHSKYHQVFWIKENNETIFFGGDDAPQLQQMKSRFVAKYDYDGKKCMELRHQWWEKGKKEHWTFLFYHDIKHPFLKQ